MSTPTRYQRIQDPEVRLALAEIVKAMGDQSTSDFPTGGIVFWLGAACPTGWAEVTALQGRFPRGMLADGTPGATGGSSTTSFEDHDNTYDLQVGSTFTPTVPAQNHTHTITPPYVDGLWCQKQ